MGFINHLITGGPHIVDGPPIFWNIQDLPLESFESMRKPGLRFTFSIAISESLALAWSEIGSIHFQAT